MIISRTPFRISFFGGGTDYPAWYEKNGGAVLSTTIDKYCYISCRYLPPFFEHKTRIVWSKLESVKNHNDIEHPAVRGILASMNINDGVEIHHDGDLPARSGVGSSSSFTVGLINALSALQGRMLTKKQLALEAIKTEQEILKENVGSQDQVASAFGGFNKIEFGGPEKIKVDPITITSPKLRSLENHLMFFFTGLSRTASEIAAEQVENTRNQSKDKELKQIHHMVDQSVDILNNGNLEDFGRLLNESWQIKRSLASNITNPKIDEIYEAARSAGALGGKISGAGGGGFVLFFVKPENQPQVREKLKNLLHVPIRFETAGSQIIFYGPTQTA